MDWKVGFAVVTNLSPCFSGLNYKYLFLLHKVTDIKIKGVNTYRAQYLVIVVIAVVEGSYTRWGDGHVMKF